MPKELSKRELIMITDEQVEILEAQLEEERSKGDEAEKDLIENDEYYLRYYLQILKLIEDYDVMETYKKDWEHPKVSREFVEKWSKRSLSVTVGETEGVLTEMLQEAGIEVEE